MNLILSRRQFIQTSAALFCAPAIVKAENIMKIWTPPERELIIPGSGEDFNFIMDGVLKGSQVYVKDEVTGDVLLNEIHLGGRLQARLDYQGLGNQLRVVVRRDSGLPFNHQTMSPMVDGSCIKIRNVDYFDMDWRAIN